MYKQFLNRATVVALLVVGSLTACKQQTVDPTQPAPTPTPTPAADLANRVTGQYTLKQVSADGKMYTADDADLKGGAKVSRISANSVKLDLAVNTVSTEEDVMVGSVSDITVTDAGNNEVNLVKGTSSIGKGSASKLSINVKGGDGVAYVLIMTK